jgi:hypothetical protein
MTFLIVIVVFVVIVVFPANKIVYGGWFSFPWSEQNWTRQERELKQLLVENRELRARILMYEREASKTSSYR